MISKLKITIAESSPGVITVSVNCLEVYATFTAAEVTIDDQREQEKENEGVSSSG